MLLLHMTKIKSILMTLAVLLIVPLFLTGCKETETYYTIVFDTKDGNSIDSIQVKHGDKITRPEDPIKDSYVFDGWFVDNIKWSFVAFGVASDVTLTARWSEQNWFQDEDGINWWLDFNGNLWWQDGNTTTWHNQNGERQLYRCEYNFFWWDPGQSDILLWYDGKNMMYFDGAWVEWQDHGGDTWWKS